jgi:disulfide bond formation protein DsbB
MIFRGSGDCTQVDWTFLGGSIANWSFVWFVIFLVVGGVLFACQLRRRDGGGVSAPMAA